jgi:hypothetical protein
MHHRALISETIGKRIAVHQYLLLFNFKIENSPGEAKGVVESIVCNSDVALVDLLKTLNILKDIEVF